MEKIEVSLLWINFQVEELSPWGDENLFLVIELQQQFGLKKSSIFFKKSKIITIQIEEEN